MAHFKFAPELFRTGTVFRLHAEGHFRKHSLEFTAKRVIRNGINSYVVETYTLANRPGEPKAFSDDMLQAFHIDHIDAIVKAGTGPLNIEYDPYGSRSVEMTYNDMALNQEGWSGVHVRGNKRSRTYYQIFSIYTLVAHLQLKFMQSGHYVFDMERCALELDKQSFMRAHSLLGKRMRAHCAPKKRVDAWFKTNKNRFLYPMKKAQKEHDKMMAEAYDRDFDRDMDLLDRELDRAHEADHPVEANPNKDGSCYDREEGFRRDDEAWREAEKVLGKISGDAKEEVAALRPTGIVDTCADGPEYRYQQQDEGDEQRQEMRDLMDDVPPHLPIYTGFDLPNERSAEDILRGLMNKPVLVKFPMNREIWDKVVVDSQEKMTVESEGQSDFVVEYETPEDFAKATTRFEGMIEHEVLATPELKTRGGEVIPRNPPEKK